MQLKRLIAAGLIALMPLTIAACGQDEDGDGAVTDEEVTDASNAVDEATDEMEEEMDEVTETTAGG